MSSERPIDLEEMRRVWRGQPDTGNDWDGRELLMEVKKKTKTFERTLYWRDMRESIAAVVVAAAMSSASILAPGWLPKVGALAVIASSIYVCVRLHRTRRRFPGPTWPLSVADGLRAEITRVDAQAELLRSVRDWYVLPIALGGTLWVVTLVPILELPAGRAFATAALVFAGSMLLFAVVGIGIVKLNRWAIREQLDPYRRELEGLLAQVEA